MSPAQQVSDKLRLLIVGAGGCGQCVAEAVLMSYQFSLPGFLDDGAFANGEAVWGFPVLGPARAFEQYVRQSTHAVVAISNNAARKKLSVQLQAAGFTLANIIHPMAIVSPRAHLGVGIAIMVGTEAALGNGAIFNSCAVVDQHAHVHEFGHLGVNASMAGGNVLGALAWMQAGSAIGYNIQVHQAPYLSRVRRAEVSSCIN